MQVKRTASVLFIYQKGGEHCTNLVPARLEEHALALLVRHDRNLYLTPEIILAIDRQYIVEDSLFPPSLIKSNSEREGGNCKELMGGGRGVRRGGRCLWRVCLGWGEYSREGGKR